MMNGQITAMDFFTISNHYSHYHLLIIFSSTLSSAIFAGRAARITLVSPPCTVFAIPQRFRPSLVLGPKLNPTFKRQQHLSLTASEQYIFETSDLYLIVDIPNRSGASKPTSSLALP